MSVLLILHRLLTHPVTIIAGVAAGFVFGFRFPEPAERLQPAADIYVSLLSMCLLPILVSALIWGIGQILRAAETQALFGRLAVIYGAGLLMPCLVGLGVALVFEPGASLGHEAQAMLGKQLQEAPSQGQVGGLLGFAKSLVPSNVFDALSRGQFISIVFFCALAGLALGVVRAPGADDTLRVLNAFYQTFSTLFGWVLVPLALGLFCIVAYNVSQANKDLLRALVSYVAFYWLAGIVLLLLHVLILALATRTAPWRPLVALKTPLILAFATDNPFVALYSAIESLQKDYAVSRAVADTIVPFGVLANQHGQVLLFAFTSVFIAQVYGVELGFGGLATLGLGCMIAGAAAVGGGAALAPILAPVLLGAEVPTALAVVVLATTQPAVANLSSMVTVQATCNLAVLTARGAAAPDPVEEAT
ncbi:MAG: cation:dicarboxylase symporter family transporter [Myxococcota bacterium]|nr:cation:dicarboxylase symporter family transporter [Myxococcota bacterium]